MPVIASGEVFFDSEWGWFHAWRANHSTEQFRLLRGERITLRKFYRTLRREGYDIPSAKTLVNDHATWSISGLQIRYV